MQLSNKYPFLTNYFTKALNDTSRALPQSILFYGNDIEAQYIIANEIARLLNCKKDKKDNCDCLNCKWINEHTHPEVKTISKFDNKPEDDESKTVISLKQAHMIQEMLISSSEYHRVFIFCDRDSEGYISGLNSTNFQAETANSLLKIIEEPQPGVTFIFLTKYIDDVLPTIISRSQCFFVPASYSADYNYSLIDGIFTNYFEFERKEAFDLSQKLTDLSQEHSVKEVLLNMQNYLLMLLKSNPKNTDFIKHIGYVENALKQADLGIRSINLFDDLLLKIIK